MKINRRAKKFHDPWGNKYASCNASICSNGYKVGWSELTSVYANEDHGNPISSGIYALDKVSCREQQYTKYVRARRASESLRR